MCSAWKADIIHLSVSLCASSLGSLWATSSYLCPRVKVLRQHVSLSLSAWCRRLASGFYGVCVLCDALMTHCWCRSHISKTQITHSHYVTLKFEQKASRFRVVSPNSSWQIPGSLRWSCFKKLKQTNSALFWHFIESLLQSGYLSVEETWHFAIITSVPSLWLG